MDLPAFEGLVVYRKARAFRRRMYKLAKVLPACEKYNLVDQIRRAAVSLTNNIAEGHGRWQLQDNIRFCRIARGSLQELLDDINTCIDEQYAEERHLPDLKADGITVLKSLNSYIASLRRKKEATKPNNRPPATNHQPPISHQPPTTNYQPPTTPQPAGKPTA